ncbi:MAG: Hsp70 suppressor, GTPase facilitates ribosomal subunit dissociation [Geoglossum umbratile]|nr:MAG: Hsp70 suppressor, GTPase facilitates ribosomal subunit dissociation [Geoglossum umbratile]
MSRHRNIRNLDLDEELDVYDGDEYYEEDSGVSMGSEVLKTKASSTVLRCERYDLGSSLAATPEQIRQGLYKVREVIGNDIPGVTNKSIEDALWHYYYDVEKSVTYLLNHHMPKPQSKPKPKLNGANTESTVGDVGAIVKKVKEFFQDSPWLNIPLHRRGEIVIEPLYPRGGLLGGSSSSTGAPTPNARGGKMSKLAALAAARKKEHGKMPGETESVGLSQSSTINLLSKLGQKPKDIPRTEMQRIQAEGDSTSKTYSARKYPSYRRGGLESKPSEPEPQLEPAAPRALEKSRELNPGDMQAKPSFFAMAMLGGTLDNSKEMNPRIGDMFKLPYISEGGYTNLDAFKGPSPDDIVTAAQKKTGKGAKGAKSGLKSTVKEKNAKQPEKTMSTLSAEDLPLRVKSKGLDVLGEYTKASPKNTANFVVIGHVDAGKSTLMGRLLFDLKVVDERTIEKFRKEAEKIGKSSFAFAWVLDQTNEERNRGVTIDIATNKFETEKTCFTVLDAPGHRDFIPNMIAGASQADFAVLVIDASIGSFESGFQARGQTKEHALLVRSMGVQRIVIAVNKLDTVDWSHERFLEIKQQILAFLTTAGFRAENLSFVPCSGLTGDNVVRKAGDGVVPWYDGPTLTEQLECSEPIRRAVEKPLRMTIGDVFKAGVQNSLSISGRLDSGSLQVGDNVVVMPSGEKAYIKGIEVDLEQSDWAVAGQNVVLHLSDIDPVHLRTGDVLCSPASPIKNITSFTAKILSFDHVTPMHVDVHRGRLHVPGRITGLVAVLDKGSGAIIKKKPRLVPPGSLARVRIEVEDAVPLEAPTRVVLRSGGETIAAGLME